MGPELKVSKKLVGIGCLEPEVSLKSQKLIKNFSRLIN